MSQRKRGLLKIGLYLVILLALALSLAGSRSQRVSLPQDNLHTLDQWYYFTKAAAG